MSLSPQQLEQRTTGITGTDIGAIAGLSPWTRPIDVWLEKTGRAAPFVDNKRTKWGTLLEPVIRSDYEERHGVRVEVPGTLVHPKMPWWLGSPDGIVYKHVEADRGLEIKVHGRQAIMSGNLEYGAPGSDEVPAHELVQCQWYMGITGIPRWDLVAFLDGAPVEYCLDRDDELLEFLAERAQRFLRDHVQKGEPPDHDGSDGWDDWLDRRWKKNDEQYIEVADEQTMTLINNLRVARGNLDKAESLVKTIAQSVKEKIGERAGLSWKEPGFKTPRRIHWKFSKASVKTDYEAAYRRVRELAALLISAHGEALESAARIVSSAPDGSTASDGKTTMSTATIAELLETARATVAEIASGAAETANSREVPGPRVFNVPRSWGKDAADAA